MYLYLLLAAAVVFSAAKAISAKRLLTAALWLAGAGAIVSALLYMLGAVEVAVIELSVGAGLVTILFVFAISIAGEDAMSERAQLPRWLAWGSVLLLLLLLGRHALPVSGGGIAFELPYPLVLWEQRSLDVLLLVIIIISGVLTALGLLSESKGARAAAHNDEAAASSLVEAEEARE